MVFDDLNVEFDDFEITFDGTNLNATSVQGIDNWSGNGRGVT